MRARLNLQENAETTSLKKGMMMFRDTTTDVNIPRGTQIATVGFWKRATKGDQNSEFRCYYYFDVPNPKTREVRRSDRSHVENHNVPIC